jgi:hypothetical protein
MLYGHGKRILPIRLAHYRLTFETYFREKEI